MPKPIDGQYIEAERLQAWLSQVDDIGSQLRGLVDALRKAPCVQISTKPLADAAASKPVEKRPAAKAKKRQTQPTRAAKAAKALGAGGGLPISPSRIRFGRYVEQLRLDYGRVVATHVERMCGQSRTVDVLRRHMRRFLGTYPSEQAAKNAYARAIGVQQPEQHGVEEVLGRLEDVIKHDSGEVSIFCNVADLDAVRRERRRQFARRDAGTYMVASQI